MGVGSVIINYMNETIEHMPTVPSETEIRKAIEALAGDRVYEEMRRLADGSGPTLIEYKSTDEAGDQLDIFYKRAGSYGPNNIAPTCSIEVMYYMGDVPCGGDVKADFVDGQWVWRE